MGATVRTDALVQKGWILTEPKGTTPPVVYRQGRRRNGGQLKRVVPVTSLAVTVRPLIFEISESFSRVMD